MSNPRIRRPRVFISYVRENETQVRPLVEALKGQGIDVWWDQENLEPAKLWPDVIDTAISKGNFFMACFSQEYQKRTEDIDGTYMNKELDIALRKMRRLSPNRTWLIPVVLSECQLPLIPVAPGSTLRDLQYIDLSTPGQWEKGVKSIVDIIKSTRTIPGTSYLFRRQIEYGVPRIPLNTEKG